jgi:hypothetical protein
MTTAMAPRKTITGLQKELVSLLTENENNYTKQPTVFHGGSNLIFTLSEIFNKECV